MGNEVRAFPIGRGSMTAPEVPESAYDLPEPSVGLPPFTITSDNGKWFAWHRRISKRSSAGANGVNALHGVGPRTPAEVSAQAVAAGDSSLASLRGLRRFPRNRKYPNQSCRKNLILLASNGILVIRTTAIDIFVSIRISGSKGMAHHAASTHLM